jgi:hypothetical protein
MKYFIFFIALFNSSCSNEQHPKYNVGDCLSKSEWGTTETFLIEKVGKHHYKLKRLQNTGLVLDEEDMLEIDQVFYKVNCPK